MFINEKWIKYNANPNGKYVGDCPKRAVSLAYNIPYKEAAKLLRGAGDWSSL